MLELTPAATPPKTRFRGGFPSARPCSTDRSMIAILLGLFAALCWALHDLAARASAPRIGPYRLALWVMLVGAALLAVPALQSPNWATADTRSIIFALLLGVAYAFGVGGLFKAFSLAPISVVGPFTAGYPALVVLWGVANGLSPSPFEWLAVCLILAGAAVVARTGHADGGVNTILPGKLKIVVAACASACLGYSASIILGQAAALSLGEFETTFLSRFPAALVLLPLALREQSGGGVIGARGWAGILVMAILDVLAVSGINYSGHFPNKELAAMGISAYGALAVVLAMAFLKERVSPGQWGGIAIVVAGVAIMAWPG
jgi:drug/metabolite transporter (DMT)-like permease